MPSRQRQWMGYRMRGARQSVAGTQGLERRQIILRLPGTRYHLSAQEVGVSRVPHFPPSRLCGLGSGSVHTLLPYLSPWEKERRLYQGPQASPPPGHTHWPNCCSEHWAGKNGWKLYSWQEQPALNACQQVARACPCLTTCTWLSAVWDVLSFGALLAPLS